MIEETAEQCNEQARESLEAQRKRHASEINALRRQHSYDRQLVTEQMAKAQAACYRAEAAVAKAHVDAAATVSRAHEEAQAEVDANKAATCAALEEAYRLHTEPAGSLFDAAVRLRGGAVDTYLSPSTGRQKIDIHRGARG